MLTAAAVGFAGCKALHAQPCAGLAKHCAPSAGHCTTCRALHLISSLTCSLGVQVSYAIGVAQPLSVHVDTYGTGTKPDKQILASVLKAFDFRPGASAAPGCCACLLSGCVTCRC